MTATSARSLPHSPADDILSRADMEPRLYELTEQSDALVGLMHAFFQRMDKGRADEFKDIHAAITQAKNEIRDIRPVDISQKRLPAAGAELEAINLDTEGATNTLMTAAERILELQTDDTAAKDAIDDQVMRIFEACSFQDITGQRVSKIVKVLGQIEERISKLVTSLGVTDDAPSELTAEEKRQRDLILHGPAIGGPETAQNDIDSLFDETPAAAETFDAGNDQDDIDSLFEEAPAPNIPAEPIVTEKSILELTAPVAAPAADPEPEASKVNSQDDIDALFD